MDQRKRLYDSYNDAVNRFKAGKDSTAFLNARKKIDSDYRGVNNKIAERQAALAKDQPESADKVILYSFRYMHFLLYLDRMNGKLECGSVTER